MHIYQSGDDSPFKVFTTAAALPAGAFRAVTLTETGVRLSAAGELPLGLLTAETEACAAGADVNVQIKGVGLWTAGEAFKAGDLLSAGADGTAVKTTSGQPVFARALENCTSGAARVQIINAGLTSAT